MLGQSHKFVNISHSTNEEDRMEICNFTVFLHESPGITDGQNISLTALLEISTETKHILEKTVGFIARTSVLVFFYVLHFFFENVWHIGEGGIIRKHGSIPDVIRIKCGGNIANIANIAT